MGNQSTQSRLSAEFWAIIGSAIAIGALVLTVSGWHRGDIQGLRVEMGSMETGLRGDMGNLETNLRGEIRLVDEKLSAKIDKLEQGQAGISARLAVVESHVLGGSAVVGDDGGTEAAP